MIVAEQTITGCKAFIFDLDGVIVFTDRFHYQAWKKMSDRIGVHFDETVNHRLRGVSRAESLEIIMERCEREITALEKAALMEEKNNTYRQLLDAMTPSDVMDEVRETLEILRRHNYKLAIGSSSKNAGFILQKVRLLELFDAVSDGNHISRSKPDPEVFLTAAKLLGTAPEDCTVIEDARSGIDAAKAAGMIAVGIGDAADYEKSDFKIQSLREMVRLAGL